MSPRSLNARLSSAHPSKHYTTHNTMATDDGAAAKAEEKPKSEYNEIENLKKLCDFLRSRQGPPIREALLMEKRVHYLKGRKYMSWSAMPV